MGRLRANKSVLIALDVLAIAFLAAAGVGLIWIVGMWCWMGACQ